FTLYAQWTANTLTVTTDEQGGSAVSNGSTTTGASMSSPGTPTRSGYTFNGWFTASSGGSAISFPYAHGQTANFTLYAQWTLTCAGGGVCVVGDTGPGGGTVFYVHNDADDMFTSAGSDCNATCRYLEVASTEYTKDWGNSGNGCYADGSSSANQDCRYYSVYSGSTSSQSTSRSSSDNFGMGMANTNRIYAQITTDGGASTNSYAAGLAWAYSYNGKSDWHLPSKSELNELCKYARNQTTGNTSVNCNSSGSLRSGFSLDDYWSSSEADRDNSKYQYFGDGTKLVYGKNSEFKVRMIRAFG
ncbi:MAG: DUF1566 domain-containing protein, partial [Actinobacteria bacterium]|nr:DUF1566 domain-containing protein [Actinomycetota bacterium]NBR92962.1 DUF1566 domain-containing protein [Actinomycetota bacterium]